MHTVGNASIITTYSSSGLVKDELLISYEFPTNSHEMYVKSTVQLQISVCLQTSHRNKALNLTSFLGVELKTITELWSEKGDAGFLRVCKTFGLIPILHE